VCGGWSFNSAYRVFVFGTSRSDKHGGGEASFSAMKASIFAICVSVSGLMFI
jgi:hypothetical protein